MNWPMVVLSKYAVFSGRARRKEYWYFSLFTFVCSLVLFEIDRMTGLHFADFTDAIGHQRYGQGYLELIFSLAVFIPSLAVTFRRLHDTDRSAWWLLIAFIPFIGAIVCLVFFCLDGTPGPNRFGEDPQGRGLAGGFQGPAPLPPSPPVQ